MKRILKTMWAMAIIGVLLMGGLVIAGEIISTYEAPTKYTEIPKTYQEMTKTEKIAFLQEEIRQKTAILGKEPTETELIEAGKRCHPYYMEKTTLEYTQNEYNTLIAIK